MAEYVRPKRPQDRISLPALEAEADLTLKDKIAKLPRGPLLPVQDDLNQALAGDEPAEQLMAEQDAAEGTTPEIDINMEPSDIASRLTQIQKEMAQVNFPKRRERGEGVDLTADIDDLKNRLAILDQAQESDQKDIEKRQLYAELATQLGKFAAAMYGQKHGIDLAGLKPEAPKFDSEYDRLLAKYKGAKADVRDVSEAGMRDKVRRAERLDKDVAAQEDYDLNKFRAQESARLQGLQGEMRGLLTAEQLRTRRELAKAREAEKEAAAIDKAALAREEQYSKLAQQINSIYRGKEPRDKKAAKAMALLQTSPLTKSIDKAEWEAALQEEGTLWGKNTKKDEEALAAITQKLSELAIANTPSAAAAAQSAGQSLPPSARAAAGQDPNIAKYAAEYNLSYSDAKRILESRGYKGQ